MLLLELARELEALFLGALADAMICSTRALIAACRSGSLKPVDRVIRPSGTLPLKLFEELDMIASRRWFWWINYAVIDAFHNKLNFRALTYAFFVLVLYRGTP